MVTLKPDSHSARQAEQVLNEETMQQACLCCSGKDYQSCCLPLHQGKTYALSAEQLMRSRFCAFSLGLVAYLKKTWAESTCPQDITLDNKLKWTRLIINGRKKGRKKDQEGWVTFLASYEIDGKQGVLHEKSYFQKDQNGHWRYVDGDIKSQ